MSRNSYFDCIVGKVYVFEITFSLHVKTGVIALSLTPSVTWKQLMQDGRLKLLKMQSFHSVFSTEFDLLHPCVIHADSTKPQTVTLSQEIIPGFHFHFFQVSPSSFFTLALYMIMGSGKHPSVVSAVNRYFWKWTNAFRFIPLLVQCKKWQWSTDPAKCEKHAVMSVLIPAIWKECSCFLGLKRVVGFWAKQVLLYCYIKTVSHKLPYCKNVVDFSVICLLPLVLQVTINQYNAIVKNKVIGKILNKNAFLT